MKRWYMGLPTDVRTRRFDYIRLFQIRLSRLMVLIAIAAVFFAAWLYNREYGSDHQAWTSSQILALNDSDATRRRQAAENLYRVELENRSRTVAALAGALADPDWQVRRAAARSIATVIRAAVASSRGSPDRDLSGDIDLAVRVLIPSFRDPRDEVRIEAQQALGTLFETARFPGSAGSVPLTTTETKAALKAVRREMQDSSPEVRAQAVWSFARVGPGAGVADDAVKELAESDPERKVRIAALDALRTGWTEDPLLYPLLLRRLKVVSDQEEHAHIGWALGSLAAPRFEDLPALIDVLSTDDWVLSQSIPTALGKLGARAQSALPALARIAQAELRNLYDPLAYEPLTAVEAIIAIDPNSTEAQALVQPLADLLRDSSSAFSRQQAAFRLMKLGPSAAAAVATLRETLKSRSPDSREDASEILGRIGFAARAALPDLAALAHDDSTPSVRKAAQAAVSAIDRSFRSEVTRSH
jgi:HEAT repeat protein